MLFYAFLNILLWSSHSFFAMEVGDKAIEDLQPPLQNAKSGEWEAFDLFCLIGTKKIKLACEFIKGDFECRDEAGVLSTEPCGLEKSLKQDILYYKDDSPAIREIFLSKEKEEKNLISERERRTQIDDTASWPYGCFVYLSVLRTVLPKENRVHGSGVLVGPHHILTCAHIVYDHEAHEGEGYALAIDAVFGFKEDKAFLGVARGVRVYVYKQFIDHHDKKFDIALVILERSQRHEIGWCGLMCLPEQDLSNETISVTGYPSNVTPNNTMWTMENENSFIKDGLIRYFIDTYKGQSGAPVWVNRSSKPYVVGIHAFGGSDTNGGVFLTKPMFDVIVRKWMAGTYAYEQDTNHNLSSKHGIDRRLFYKNDLEEKKQEIKKMRVTLNQSQEMNITMLLNQLGFTNIDEKNDYGITVLHEAAVSDNSALVELIIQKCPTIINERNKVNNMTALQFASKKGMFDVVEVLLNNRETDMTTKGLQNRTALHEAVLAGYPKIVSLLLQRNPAGVAVLDTKNNTPLHLAVKKYDTEMVTLLLNANVPIEAHDSDGLSALHLAAWNDKCAIVKLILAKGASIDAQDGSSKCTALHWAAWNGHVDMVELLLGADAKIDIQDDGGMTALHWAAKEGKKEVVELLLDAGANKEIKNTEKKSAVQIARSGKHKDVVYLLKNYKITPTS